MGFIPTSQRKIKKNKNTRSLLIYILWAKRVGGCLKKKKKQFFFIYIITTEYEKKNENIRKKRILYLCVQMPDGGLILWWWFLKSVMWVKHGKKIRFVGLDLKEIFIKNCLNFDLGPSYVMCGKWICVSPLFWLAKFILGCLCK